MQLILININPLQSYNADESVEKNSKHLNFKNETLKHFARTLSNDRERERERERQATRYRYKRRKRKKKG